MKTICLALLSIITLTSINSCSLSTQDRTISTAKKIVLNACKSPTTANITEEKILERKGNLYLVQVTVDAQNAFGAVMRNYCLVVFELSGDTYYSTPHSVQSFENEPSPFEISLTKDINGWDNWTSHTAQ